MKTFIHFLKKCFSKWWIKWPVVLLGSLMLIVAVYLMSFNSVTRSQEKAFIAKWQPLVGSLKHDDVFPNLKESDDLAKDPSFIKLTADEGRTSWYVMGFIGAGEEDDYKQILPSSDTEERVIDLAAWYSDSEGLNEKQIAEAALAKLREKGEDIKELEMLLDKYSEVSSVLTNLKEGESPFKTDPAIRFIGMARIFSERAILHAYAQDAESAMRDLSYVRKLRKLAGGSPGLVNALVDAAVSMGELNSLKYCLQQRCFTKPQLRKLLAEFKPMNASQCLAKSARAEYVYSKALSAYMASEDFEMPSFGGFKIGGEAMIKILPNSIALSSTLHSLDFQLEHMYYPAGKLVDRFTLTQYETVQAKARIASDSYNPRMLLAKQMLGVMPRQMLRFLEWQAQMEMSEIGIAFELYRMDNEEYPKRMSDLVPQYLPKLNKDPFSKKLDDYQYFINKKGYPVIYSIGENGVDDGGKVRLSSSTGDDETDTVWAN